MINRIDIANFGSFNGLTWNQSIRDRGNNVQDFKRLNILYGRNYSGKTTLSRIFRALETKRIPFNHVSPSFTIYGDKGNITQSDIETHNYDIRVYNRDFVNDHLSFLVNQISGEIKTFAIVGEKNKEIEDAINAIEAELGSVEAETGLRFELQSKSKERDRSKSHYNTASESLEGKLRAHANDKIKKNREYGNSLYNIDGIKRDINATKRPEFRPLSIEEQASKSSLLKQDALPDIEDTIEITLNIENIKSIAETLLSKTITPTAPIQELLNDSVLQLWVKQGISLHREARMTCAFCRQSLPHDIWQVLDSHFSKESSDLELSIDNCLTSIATEIESIHNYITLTGDMFYSEERAAFELSKNTLNEGLAIYKQDLIDIQNALQMRKNTLFNVVPIPTLAYDAVAIQKQVSAINGLITQSNSRTETLEKDKSAARDALRLNDVAAFIETIKYDDEKTRIASLKTAAEIAQTTFTDKEKEISNRETKVTQLRERQKDERKGADKVNSLLNHFFGHDGIKLEAKDNPEKTAVKFEVTRNGNSAYNLSEGECSLIAFCYFIAKLEEPESTGKELIICTSSDLI
jgi:wobble nucleotide-excising tRNase